MSLATVNCGPNSASVQLFGSVFDRRAPESKPRVEAIIGKPMGQGTGVKEVGDAFLAALTAAYEEAAQGKLATFGRTSPSSRRQSGVVTRYQMAIPCPNLALAGAGGGKTG